MVSSPTTRALKTRTLKTRALKTRALKTRALKTRAPATSPPAANAALTISALAAEFGITTRAIRFYDERGLIQSSRRGGVRIYTPAERVKLMLILRGKRLGFSLEESRDIINMYDPGSENSRQLQFLLEKVREKREQLERKRKEIGSMLKDLDSAEQNCLDTLAGLAAPTRRKK